MAGHLSTGRPIRKVGCLTRHLFGYPAPEPGVCYYIAAGKDVAGKSPVKPALWEPQIFCVGCVLKTAYSSDHLYRHVFKRVSGDMGALGDFLEL